MAGKKVKNSKVERPDAKKVGVSLEKSKDRSENGTRSSGGGKTL